MVENFLQLITDKTEVLISAPAHVVPEVERCLGSLSSAVKPVLHNLGCPTGSGSEPGPAREQFGPILFPPSKEYC